MIVRRLHPFDLPPREAVLLQRWLAAKVVARGPAPRPLRLVAGVDASPTRSGDPGGDGDLCAVAVVCTAPDWQVVEVASATGRPSMPYVPGLLSFREAPLVLEALRRLRTTPQAILVDGHGVAHPRRLGIAAHVGLHVDVPVVGVGKSVLVGTHAEPGRRAGSSAPLRDGRERIGTVLRTRDGVQPVFVSVGNRIGLAAAVRLVAAVTTRFRLPEPIRQADLRSRALARGPASGRGARVRS